MLDLEMKHLIGVVGWILSVLTLAGCQSAGNPQTEAPPLRPIERVHAGIIAVRDQSDATLTAAEAMVADPSRTRQNRFNEDLRLMETAVQTLRNDATELRERANEYLILWSGQSTGFTNDGRFYERSDDRYGQRKTKYEEMVKSLQAARDEILPLMTDLKGLSASPSQTIVQPARQRQTRAAAHLNTAVTQLDELTQMFKQTGRSSE